MNLEKLLLGILIILVIVSVFQTVQLAGLKANIEKADITSLSSTPAGAGQSTPVSSGAGMVGGC